MAVTFKQLLNRAFKITGEDQIGTGTTVLSDATHILYAEIANELLEEIQDAHNWRALRQVVTVTATGATSTLDSGSDSDITCNERSRIIRIHEPHYGELVPMAFDTTDSSAPTRILELDLPELLRRRTMDPNTTGDPCFFALDNSSGDVLKLELYPTPDTTKTIKLHMIIPQDRLDGTVAADLATTIKIPVRPVTMALIRFILEERGEELGPNSRWSEEKEYNALRDLISLDMAEQGMDSLVPV